MEYLKYYAVAECSDGTITASRHGYQKKENAETEKQEMKAFSDRVALCKASNQCEAINIAAKQWS